MTFRPAKVLLPIVMVAGVACTPSRSELCPPDYPCRVDNGAPGTIGIQDANPNGPDAMPPPPPAMLQGRVCLVTDLRFPTACAASGADGFAISVSTAPTASATTAADGSFSLPATVLGTYTYFTARRTGYVTSSTAYVAPATPLLPTLAEANYQTQLAENGVVLNPTEGGILVRLTSGITPVAGATVTTTPVARLAAYYDGENALLWPQRATGAAGMMWLPTFDAGAVNVVVKPPESALTVNVQTEVRAATLTYLPIAAPM